MPLAKSKLMVDEFLILLNLVSKCDEFKRVELYVRKFIKLLKFSSIDDYLKFYGTTISANSLEIINEILHATQIKIKI